MALVHFSGEELEEYIDVYREDIVSFASGASISYIFIQLLPEFHRIVTDSGRLIFIFPLIGFSSIHLLEKYLAKSDIEDKKLKRDYGEIHSVFLFLYHGSLGYLVASLVAESPVSGLLFFTPIVLHIAVSSFSVTELHKNFMRRLSVKLAISLAPILGVISFYFDALSKSIFHPVLGTVLGMFFYVVIRDSLPSEDRGRISGYFTGMIIYLAVIIIGSSI